MRERSRTQRSDDVARNDQRLREIPAAILEGLVEEPLDQHLLGFVDALVGAAGHRIQLVGYETTLDQDGLKQLDEDVERRTGQWLAEQMAIGLGQPINWGSDVRYVVHPQ